MRTVEKLWSIVGVIFVTAVLTLIGGSVWMGHVAYQKSLDACSARGGNLVIVAGDRVCATVNYEVVPK